VRNSNTEMISGMNETVLSRTPVLIKWLFGTLVLLGSMSLEHSALAQDADDATDDATTTCVDAYERAQERLVAGALMEARERFVVCSRPSCPSFIYADCTRFLERLGTEIPAVSFEVESGDRRLGAVRIIEGERVLHHGAASTTIELDPGRHVLRFEAPGAEPVTRSLFVERKERDRVMVIDLPPAVAPVPPPRPAAAPSAESKLDPAPWVALGVGTAGVGAFVVLGSMGLSEEKRLERTCAPSCGASELRSVRMKYLFADVALTAGVTSLLAGGYLLFRREREPEPAAHVGALPLLVEVDRHGGAASLKGQF
jgi:hypothetical protein